MMKLFALSLLLLLSSCSYQALETNSGTSSISISVPAIPGDTDGSLNTALVKSLSQSGKFECRRVDGDYILDVKMDGDNVERVGFQYDRDPTSGDLRKNLIGTENRRSIGAIITLRDGVTNKIILGPQRLEASTVYDYLDSDNVYDLSFMGSSGNRLKVLDFSLGQLDTIEGAQDASLQEIYNILAEKITDGMITQKW